MKIRSHYWWDVWAALFLLGTLMTASIRLVVTHWTDQLAQVILAAILAFVLGIILGFSRHRQFLQVFYTTSYGVIVIIWLLSAIDTSSLLFRERVMSIYQRLADAIHLFINDQHIYDPILFILFMLVVFWILGVFTSFHLIRHGTTWRCILPVGIAILIINHYDLSNKSGILLVAVYLFWALLYIGRITFLKRWRDWKKENIQLPAEASGNIFRIVILIGIVLLFFAWLIPVVVRQDQSLSPAWRSIESSWIRLRERFSGAFEGIQSGEKGEIVLYSDKLELGTKARGGTGVLFTVEPKTKNQIVLSNYWVVRYYDRYLDGTWTSTLEDRIDTPAGKYLPVYPEWDSRVVGRFVITTGIPKQGSLIFPQYSFWVGRFTQAFTGTATDPSRDVGYIRTVPALEIGESYEIRAWVNAPTQHILRESSTDYPEWVTSRYLNLPGSLDARVKDLARDITPEAGTPFDSSLAITQYLRKNITYQKEMDTPPEDVDPVTWFLLDYKTGYCNYYASAEVLMLRSLGIPARISVGYAEGKYNIAEGYYEVHGEDSHAWPEVYFSGWGWVPFEPTVSQPEIVLPSGEEETLDNGPRVNEPVTPDSGRYRDPMESVESEAETGDVYIPVQNQIAWWVWAAIILGSLAILEVIWLLVIPRLHLDRLISWLISVLGKTGTPVSRQLEHLRCWLAMTPIERAYLSLDRALAAFHQELNPAETPLEKLKRFNRIFPEKARQASSLVEEFQRHQFSPVPADIRRAQRLGRQIRWATDIKQIRIWLGMELRSDAYR
jgi:transglutaminase-like putative cysteine protease